MRILVFILVLVVSLIVSSTEALATQASLKCLPASGTYKIGETITVDYVLDTRSFQAFGADIVATFDTHVLTNVDTQSTPNTITTNWSQPTTNTVTDGKIRLDYGKSQPAYTGSGSIGQIKLKGVAAGQANFNFLFIQQYDDTTAAGGAAKVWGKKDGTNISNILTDVNNCIYVIEGEAPTATVGPTSPPAPSVTQLPRSGAVETTISLLGIAGIFIAFGTILPALTSRKD